MDSVHIQEANSQLSKLAAVVLEHMYQFAGLLLPDGRDLVSNSPALAGAVRCPSNSDTASLTSDRA